MRESRNEELNGVVKNGFDYDLQVWVVDYIIQPMRSAIEQGIHNQDIRKVKL